MPGKVYIVGAGPGSPDLLTVRAASLLQCADVILYDDLVSDEILKLAHPSATMINVGKRCGRHSTTQDKTNALMVKFGQRTGTVVRLKSGDPSLFGRLAEELEALRDAGIPFEIVPGVTAATTAAAAANFALTDRRTTSALVALTAHNVRGSSLAEVLSDSDQTTYAVYMPGPDYAATGRELLRLGLDPETPCALVSHAGRTHQQIRFFSLSMLRSITTLASPAILIVGKVVRSSEFVESTTFLEEVHESVCNAIQDSAH